MLSIDTENNDPLGLGVKGRARENRLKLSLQGLQAIGGPLPDPNWEGFLQSLEENNVDQLQGGPSARGSNQLTGFSPTATVKRGGFSQKPSSLAGLQAGSLGAQRDAQAIESQNRGLAPLAGMVDHVGEDSTTPDASFSPSMNRGETWRPSVVYANRPRKRGKG